MSKRKSRDKGLPLMLIGLLLIVAALVVFLICQQQDSEGAEMSEAGLAGVNAVIFEKMMQQQDEAEQHAAEATPAVTAPPTTAPPATEAPAATEIPVTEAPAATDIPATEAPDATEIPATEAPDATEIPATEAPDATEIPATEAPAATEIPATEAPVATEIPAPEAPATATPEATEPIVKPSQAPIWERVPEYAMPEADIPVAKDLELTFIGKITIPTIEVDLPVQSTWSYEQLAYSPCRYAGSVYRDGFVLIAHRFNSHFSGIGNLVPGDRVNFTDMDGNLFRYEVVSTETLNPDQTSELVDDKYALTLMTCTFSSSQRVVVRCQRRN